MVLLEVRTTYYKANWYWYWYWYCVVVVVVVVAKPSKKNTLVKNNFDIKDKNLLMTKEK